jgi:type IV secretion system protein VirB1
MPLADFYAHCGPWVHPDTIAAVVALESGGRAWAIGTPHGAHYASTKQGAEIYLAQALRFETNVDIGLMQINSQWIGRLHVAPHQLLDPCFNVRIGAAILAADFVTASRPGRSLLQTLIAALSAYNSGSETVNISYASQVLRLSEQPQQKPIAGDAKDRVNAVHIGAGIL